MSLIDEVVFGADGLVSVIVRDAASGDVLTLGYMDAESLAETVHSRRVRYAPRGRESFSSTPAGEGQAVSDIRLGCGGEALLLTVVADPGVHRGFPPQGESLAAGRDILQAVYDVILNRKDNPSEKSYVASLYAKGLDKILGKVGEEATEVAVAGKGGDSQEVVYEVADLFFHTLVLLGYYDLPPERVYAELRRRFGLSGIAEKESRTTSSTGTGQG